VQSIIRTSAAATLAPGRFALYFGMELCRRALLPPLRALRDNASPIDALEVEFRQKKKPMSKWLSTWLAP